MKKFFVILFLMVFLPISIFAEEKEEALNLEDTLKLDNINIDLSNYKEDEKKVNIYLFWGNGCPHCKDFLEFVSSELVPNYSDYFNFTGYEVWKNKANSSLMNKVADAFEVSKENRGVPFIVIGEEHFVGYGERLNDTIINVLKNEYAKSSRRDIVDEVLTGKTSSVSSEKNEDDDKDTTKDNSNDDSNYGRTQVKDESKSDWLIKVILVIVGLALGAIVVVLCNPKKVLNDKNKK